MSGGEWLDNMIRESHGFGPQRNNYTQVGAKTGRLKATNPNKVQEQTEELLKKAIESHFIEVYGGEKPNFCWDIELYQKAGLLPEDYEPPTEDHLEDTIYGYRKLLEAALDRLEQYMENYIAMDDPDEFRQTETFVKEAREKIRRKQ